MIHGNRVKRSYRESKNLPLRIDPIKPHDPIVMITKNWTPLYTLKMWVKK